MTQKTKRLSRAEWAVMNLCWKLGKSTARQIYEALGKEDGREYQTVKTLLDRISAKGYLKTEKLGPLCRYTPRVSRSAATKRAIAEFTETVLGDSLAPLFQHLAEDQEINDEELSALRNLVRRAEEEHK